MTQRISDEGARQCVDEFADCPHAVIGQQACEDLLSLRAAVRRVLHRKRIADDAFVYDFAESYHDLTVALDALRAEMGGIDKDGAS